MREWLRRLFGRTKLERIERLQGEHKEQLGRLEQALTGLAREFGSEAAQRVTNIAAELEQLDRRLLLAVQEHSQQMHALSARIEQLATTLNERDQLRERLRGEEARVRELADQTGHLLSELGAERRALHDARSRAGASDELRTRCDHAERELGATQRERDALRANAERLEAACRAAERAREAIEAELARIKHQRDELLRGNGAAGAVS